MSFVRFTRGCALTEGSGSAMIAPQLLISVIIANFNHGRFLRAAIESVLMQTYPYFEILCVDDGSTDDSREIIDEIAREDARLKPVFFEQNRGVLQASDNGWRRASGALVYWLAADDALSDPDFFRLGVEAMVQNPAAAGFYGLTQTISAETGCSRGSMGSGLREGFIEPAEFVRGFLRGEIFVPGSSALWRKQLVEEVGGLDPALGPQCDYFINHILPALHGVVFCSRTFNEMRVWESKTSFSGNASIEQVWERLQLFERKMRSASPMCDSHADDWLEWRQAQVLSLLYPRSPVQVFLVRVKSRLRAWLPRKMFFVTDRVARCIFSHMMRVIARQSSRYRSLMNKSD